MHTVHSSYVPALLIPITLSIFHINEQKTRKHLENSIFPCFIFEYIHMNVKLHSKLTLKLVPHSSWNCQNYSNQILYQLSNGKAWNKRTRHASWHVLERNRESAPSIRNRRKTNITLLLKIKWIFPEFLEQSWFDW